MHFVKVPEGRPDMMVEFAAESMFTFEGIDNKILDKHSRERKEFSKMFESLMRKFGVEGEIVVYYFYGNFMNDVFGYTGENAYPEDFGFLVIPDFHIPEVKQAFNARWFDDIISSNSIKQHALDDGLDPDFQ